MCAETQIKTHLVILGPVHTGRGSRLVRKFAWKSLWSCWQCCVNRSHFCVDHLGVLLCPVWKGPKSPWTTVQDEASQKRGTPWCSESCCSQWNLQNGANIGGVGVAQTCNFRCFGFPHQRPWKALKRALLPSPLGAVWSGKCTEFPYSASVLCLHSSPLNSYISCNANLTFCWRIMFETGSFVWDN